MSAPPTLLGRYTLERRIASGGMADVYLARQEGSYGFTKRVALKILKREIAGDRDNVAMFVREALVAAEFRHPNLAQVYEVGEIDGRLFIAMELVRGLSVASLQRELHTRGRTLPVNVAVRIAIDTLDGLLHAHEARGPDGKALDLVHRDISPQNIMVGVDGAVKVVDFGIARAQMTSISRTDQRTIKGKFNYMPPEQWEADGVIDARADLFAVGVVLYEMTTGGARLFEGDEPQALYRTITMDPIPAPKERVPDYPDGLARIVMRALERGVKARWPSARAFRTALVEFAQAEGWSLSSKAVADAMRAALGSDEIESRWEPVGNEPGGVRDSDTQVEALAPGSGDAPTRDVRPGRRAGAGRSGDRTRAWLGALAALTIGAAVGFTLGEWRGRHVTAHVRVVWSGERGWDTLAPRWRIAHPEIAADVTRATRENAVRAVQEGRADVGVEEERGITADGRPTLGLIGRGQAHGAVRSFVDWIRTQP